MGDDRDVAIAARASLDAIHGDPTDAAHRAFVAIGGIVQKQAFILAFSDTFYLLGVALIVALVASLFLKKPGHLDAGGAH